ncbi:type II secretion system F family protein [Nocardioides sp. Bht2]|uniref:type II secretion system F family protein n=1 Tax=Nocardioides sp. Bht2 TaxID=3392297 RepID=UPI0039B3CED3
MRRAFAAVAAAVACIGLSAVAHPASAAEDDLQINHIQSDGGTVKLLATVPEASADEITVTIAGKPATVEVEKVEGSSTEIVRTAVIAFDTSKSMRGKGFLEPAKAAALAFVDSVPDDVRVGLVTYDSAVQTLLKPTLDRDQARTVIGGLRTAPDTLLNDGIIQAVAVAGNVGQRQVLVLSDGRDSGNTPDTAVIAAIQKAGVQVDVVALHKDAKALSSLEAFAEAGNGTVIDSDAEALRATFSDEAAALSRQMLISAAIPDGASTVEANVVLTAGELSTNRQVVLREAETTLPPAAAGSNSESSIQISKPVLYAGIAALGLGLLLLLGGVMYSATSPRTGPSAEQRIAAYTSGSAGPARGDGPQLTLDQARDAAASVLSKNKGVEERIAARLVAAGSQMRAAEWVLLHGAIALLAGLVGALLGGGSLLVIVIFLILGALVPWLWLGFKRKRRLDAFGDQLPDTLQLIAGSLSAGMSLAQSLQTVVEEGSEPMAGEFRRALVDARLGLPLEDALEEIARRTQSRDFAWVVMAIRIQRQVGGNLGELLTTVAATMRERAYLRRQVRTLSAEGRLSGWILGLLPVAMALYMLLVRREYISKLWTEPMGLALLVAAVVMLSLGGFVISRIVKVEV